jgi:hypothetical protein
VLPIVDSSCCMPNLLANASQRNRKCSFLFFCL